MFCFCTINVMLKWNGDCRESSVMHALIDTVISLAGLLNTVNMLQLSYQLTCYCDVFKFLLVYPLFIVSGNLANLGTVALTILIVSIRMFNIDCYDCYDCYMYPSSTRFPFLVIQSSVQLSRFFPSLLCCFHDVCTVECLLKTLTTVLNVCTFSVFCLYYNSLVVYRIF